LLSWEWLQVIQDTFADLMGVMLVVTDTNGKPVHQPANPCGLFTAFRDQADAMPRFINHWKKLATTIDMTPSFQASHLDLLCARSLIAVGTEIKGLVIAGCIAPAEWPPNSAQIATISERFQVTTDFVSQHVNDVYYLDEVQQAQVLATLPRIAALIAHVVNDRKMLMDRLSSIANLTQFNL
jgi:ligand-binding sensor protein